MLLVVSKASAHFTGGDKVDETSLFSLEVAKDGWDALLTLGDGDVSVDMGDVGGGTVSSGNSLLLLHELVTYNINTKEC